MKRIVSFGAMALASVAATQLAAQTRFSNDTGGSADFYGQLSPAFTYVDDSVDTTDTVADNSHSSSRIGFNVFQEVGEGYRVRFRFETGLGLRATNGVSQTEDGDSEWTREDLRHVDIQVRTPSFGTFSLGQGSMSGDGVGQIDKSGTTLANYVASSADTAGSFAFRNTDGTLSRITVADVLSDFDPSRRGRIRYDTPSFSGFQLSLSYGKNILSEDSTRDDYHTGAAITYETSFESGIEVAAGIGYEQRERETRATGAKVKRDDIFASASVLLPSGLNFTGAVGQRDQDGRSFTSQYYYIKAGYRAQFFDVGRTAFSIDYFDGSDYSVSGDSSSAWGVGLVQTFSDLGLETYVGYRTYTYDRPTANFEDITSWLVGARFRF